MTPSLPAMSGARSPSCCRRLEKILVALLLAAAGTAAAGGGLACGGAACGSGELAQAACTAEEAEELLAREAPVLLQVSKQLEPPAPPAQPAEPAPPPAEPEWSAQGASRGRWRSAGICAVAVVGVGLASAALFISRRRGRGAAGRAVAVDLVCVFQENVLFTLIMVDALDLSVGIGQDAAFSGVLIGAHKLGTGLGSLLLWLLLLYNPELWRRGRVAVAAGVLLQLAGAIAFGLLGLSSRGESAVVPPGVAAPALCLSRALQGLGGGLQLALASNHIARLVPKSERVPENMNFFLAACLGLALGPLFASLSKLAVGALPCEQPGSLLDAVLVVNMVLPFVQLSSLLAYPSLNGAEDQHSQTREDSESLAVPIAPTWRVVVIFSCVLIQIIRNFSVSSLEAALTLLLESQYQWSPTWVGPAVALVLSSCLWLKLAYDACRGWASTTAWLRIMIGIALVGAVLLLPPPSSKPAGWADAWQELLPFGSGAHPELRLLLGSSLLFPALALSSGLIMGTLQEHVFQGDSFLNLNTATLLTLVGADLLGRGLGPPAARGAVEAGGQGLFALHQIVAGVLALLVHEVLVLAARPCAAARRKAASAAGMAELLLLAGPEAAKWRPREEELPGKTYELAPGLLKEEPLKLLH